MAYLVVENVMLEVFRDQNLMAKYAESMSLQFYRRVWECEFHMTFDWSPVSCVKLLLPSCRYFLP